MLKTRQFKQLSYVCLAVSDTGKMGIICWSASRITITMCTKNVCAKIQAQRLRMFGTAHLQHY